MLLVTLDTLRADHLGCYGAAGNPTPRIDRLAAEGAMFADASTPVPITLPSHASILTGVLPPAHGVRDNGDFRLPADRPTLAEILRAGGYSTGAFVGAVVLDSAFGLDRGFDHYDDAIHLPAAGGGSGAASYPDRPAGEVVDAALAWLQALPAEQRFLAWVHLFDPHAPYAPPEPYRSRFGSTYAGEVAYVDEQVGRLLDGLARLGRDRHTLVVLVADHGEGLGEHGETTHGFFLYQSTVHVPLILRLPDVIPPGIREAAPVSTLDILPTVLEWTGKPQPPGLAGRSLAPAARREPLPTDRDLYLETYLPYFQMRWSGSRGLRSGQAKWIAANPPELYDLAADPGEARDLAASGSPLAAALPRRFEALASTIEPPRGEAAAPALDAETQAKLRSLGYLSGGGGEPRGDLAALAAARPDTRDRIRLVDAIQDAAPAAIDRNDPEALRRLEALADDDPGNPRLLALVGKGQMEQGRIDAAVESLQRAADLDPADARARANLAAALLRAGRAAEAAKAIDRAVELRSGDPEIRATQASLLLDSGRAAEAEATFRALLTERPGDPASLRGLGRALAAQKRWAEASETLEIYLQAAPDSTEDLVLAGTAAYRIGDAERAAERFQRALGLDAANLGALLGLGIVFGERGDDAGAAALLERAARAAPDRPQVLTAYGVAAARAGNAAAARRALARSLSLDPNQPQAREALRALGG